MPRSDDTMTAEATPGHVASTDGLGGGHPKRATATPLMRSMLSRAGHIGADGQALVTEWVGRKCVQCRGRMVQRRTLDGWQPVAAFSWLIDSRRASKADVWRLTSKTHND